MIIDFTLFLDNELSNSVLLGLLYTETRTKYIDSYIRCCVFGDVASSSMELL